MRSEYAQAEYFGTQIGLLEKAHLHAVLVYVFFFPYVWKSQAFRTWAPKEVFYRVAKCFKD